jgi:hypothetical protein
MAQEGVREGPPATTGWPRRRDAEEGGPLLLLTCACLVFLPVRRTGAGVDAQISGRARDDSAAHGRGESILGSAQGALVSWFVFPYEAHYPVASDDRDGRRRIPPRSCTGPRRHTSGSPPLLYPIVRSARGR